MPSHTEAERKKKRQGIAHKKHGHGHFQGGLNPRLVETREVAPRTSSKPVPKRRTK